MRQSLANSVVKLPCAAVFCGARGREGPHENTVGFAFGVFLYRASCPQTLETTAKQGAKTKQGTRTRVQYLLCRLDQRLCPRPKIENVVVGDYGINIELAFG